MGIFIKLCGITLFVGVCAFGGFLKAFELKKREKELTLYIECITELKNRIFYEGAEVEGLLDTIFKSNSIEIVNARPSFFKTSLLMEDITVLEDFFKKLGSEGCSGEVARAELCINLLEKQRERAERDITEKSRLYKALGLSIGAFGAIFFI